MSDPVPLLPDGRNGIRLRGTRNNLSQGEPEVSETDSASVPRAF